MNSVLEFWQQVYSTYRTNPYVPINVKVGGKNFHIEPITLGAVEGVDVSSLPYYVRVVDLENGYVFKNVVHFNMYVYLTTTNQ